MKKEYYIPECREIKQNKRVVSSLIKEIEKLETEMINQDVCAYEASIGNFTC